MKKYKPIAFHFNGDAIKKYPEGSLLPLNDALSGNSEHRVDKTGRKDSCRILTFDNRFDRPLYVDLADRLGIRFSNTPEQGYPLKEPFLVNCCKKLGLDTINLGDEKYYGPVKVKYTNPSKRFVGAHGSKSFRGNFLLTHKIFSVFDYLKNHNTAEYFYFFDQSDVFLTDDPENRLEYFKSKSCKLLFNAESKFMYFPNAVKNSFLYKRSENILHILQM